MALSWDALGEEFPSVALSVQALSAAVDRAHRGIDAHIRFEVPSGMDRLASWLPDREAILGVGYVVDDEGPVPAVFADTAAEPWDTVATTEIAVAPSREHPVRSGPVRAIALPRARAFYGTGEECDSAGGVLGTGGARVRAPNGTVGVITAGHVGGPPGSTIRDAASNRVGAVAISSDPANAPPLSPVVDAAFVAFAAGVADSGQAHGTGRHAVKPRDDLDIYGAKSGHAQTWVRGASPSWAGPDPKAGDWGFVVITRDGITGPGDSGAIALFAGTTDVVGHVVGGVPGVYSLVQEIDYQLGLSAAPSVTGALAGVSLR